MKATRFVCWVLLISVLISIVSCVRNPETPTPAPTPVQTFFFHETLWGQKGNVPTGFVNILETSLTIEDNLLSATMTVAGDVPAIPKAYVAFIWSIDADGDANTGNKLNGIGIDYNLRVSYDPDPNHKSNYGWYGYIDVMRGASKPSQTQFQVKITANKIVLEFPTKLIDLRQGIQWFASSIAPAPEKGDIVLRGELKTTSIVAPSAETAVNVEIMVNQLEFSRGQSVNVAVWVDPGKRGVSALELNLVFPASAVTIVDIEPGDFLSSNPLVGNKVVDTQRGLVSYALARTSPTIAPSVAGVYAIVKAKVADTAANGSYDFKMGNIRILDESLKDIQEIKTSGTSIRVLTAGIMAPATANLSQIVQGVSRIFAGANTVPGPVEALDSAWIPIIAGDSDTTTPNLYSIARIYGLGRILAIGHEGLLVDQNIDNLDNLLFALNTVSWLDSKSTKKIAFSTGHKEWTSSGISRLRKELEQRGYEVMLAPSTLTVSQLQSQGVLIVGNSWGQFTDSEIAAVKDFVSNGGGLLLAGLGWSWEPYNPGKTINDYPMNQLSVPFGMRWIIPVISDPTDNYQNSPIFHTFYPNIGPSSLTK